MIHLCSCQQSAFGTHLILTIEHDAGDLGAAQVDAQPQTRVVLILAHVTLASTSERRLVLTRPGETTRVFGDRLMIRQQLRLVGYIIVTRLVVGAVPFGQVDALPETQR